MLSTSVISDDRISIDLRGGGRVTGTLLTEKPDALFVDLGHDVVRLPKDQILKRQKFTGSEVVSTTPPATVSEDDMDGFYKTGGMDGKSVRQLVDQFGEGVISIDTPSSNGSGFLLNGDGYAITNQHVIAGETRISATLYKKNPSGALQRVRVEEVEIVAMNPLMDLALIRLPKREDLTYKPCSLSVDELAAILWALNEVSAKGL
jgi:serine protease Do